MPQPGRDQGATTVPAPSRNRHKVERKEPGEKTTKKEKGRKDSNSKGDKKDRRQHKDGKGGKNGAGPTGTRRRSPDAGQMAMQLPPKPEPTLRSAGAAPPAGAKAPSQEKKQKTKGERSHMGWWWWVKLLSGIIFLAAYAVGVLFLTAEVIQAKSSAATSDSSPACQRLQCPSDSVCVTNNGRGQCNENSYQNLQILQIILGIVVGVPGVVCLPCTLQWSVNTGGPLFCAWYTDRRRRLRVGSVARGSMKTGRTSEALGTESTWDLENGGEEAHMMGTAGSRLKKGGLLARLLSPWGGKPEASPESPDSPAIGAASMGASTQEIGTTGDEDDMSIFFAKTDKKKKEGEAGEEPQPKPEKEDDFLDLVFAKRPGDTAPPAINMAGDDGLEAPDEDLWGDRPAKKRQADDGGFDDIFAKPVRAKAAPAKAEQEDFDDFFHRPPNRAPQKGTALPPIPGAAPGRGNALPPMPGVAPARQGADVASNFSAGLSAIFATANKAPASRVSGPASRAGADSMASDYEEEEEEYEDEGDDGDYEQPDFIGFALGIARKAAPKEDDQSSFAAGSDIYASRVGAGDWDDARSDASGASNVDSLAGLEESLLSDLFHPPV